MTIKIVLWGTLMEREPLIKEIEYYQYYLGKAVAQIYINERICDFYDCNNEKYSLFADSLSEISSALLLSHRIIFSNIFIGDRDSKHIRRLLNRLNSTKIVSQDDIHLKIKVVADSLINEIDKQSVNIDKLKEYRDNILAHFNTKFFDDDWRKNLPIQYSCDFIAIKNLAIKIYNGLSQILILLKSVPLDNGMMTPYDINKLIEKLS